MNVQTSMNIITQSNAPVHIGVDVAKAELVADLNGTIKRYPNTPAGIARLTRAAAAIPGAHLVCEATAGYEKALVSSSWQLGIPVSTVPPQRVRQLAKVLGLRAKSDPIDARLISRFGATALPKPSSPKPETRTKLDALMRFRDELMDSLKRESCRHEHHEHPLVKKLAKARIARLEKDIAEVDRAAADLIAADAELARADAKLREVTGVGHQSSRTLLAFMPELGTLNRRQIASLAGLAPFDRDSGTSSGKRFIRAGRGSIRSTLHMAAISAARFNPVLRPFYLRLRKAGKPFKVAIVAVTRKLLIHLNSLMAKILKIPVAG
jgi:transposase